MQITRMRLIDIVYLPFLLTFGYFGAGLLSASNAEAFTKLKNGFETLTRTYLIPTSSAVAGCAFILFVTLSYFKKDEYQKLVGNVLALAVLTRVGLELIDGITQSFA